MKWIPALAVLAATASLVAVATGAWLLSPPAGLITAGAEGLAAAWMVLYVYRQSVPPPPPTKGRGMR